jgi:F0F1-type ATP synthase membrane subunit c/vacuolar-type H+-ATPase subunit K
MAIDKITRSTLGTAAAISGPDQQRSENPATKNSIQADSVGGHSFASKTISLIGKAIKAGIKISINAGLAIAKSTVLAALKVGKAFAAAIQGVIEDRSKTLLKSNQKKTLQARRVVHAKEVPQAQAKVVSGLKGERSSGAKEREEIANLERRAKALKEGDSSLAREPNKSTKRNQDYTNFEKSTSTLNANAKLSSQDKKDIDELEKRLRELKKP